jgi:hypothetical protein
MVRGWPSPSVSGPGRFARSPINDERSRWLGNGTPFVVSQRTNRDSGGDTSQSEIQHGSEVDRDLREWGTEMAHLASPYQRSNPRNFLYRSCGRKVVHLTEEIAEAARRLTEASKGNGPLHSYRCDFCAGWHVGHFFRPKVARWSADVERRRDPLRRDRRSSRRANRSRRWT